MPLNIHQLHTSLLPNPVEWCAEKPDKREPNECEMLVWKDTSCNTWRFKTKLLNKIYEDTFTRQLDARLIFKLDGFLQSNSKVFPGDIITEALEEKIHQISPHSKLSQSQQGTIIGALHGLEVFDSEVNAITRKEVCLAVLNRDPSSDADSETLKDLRACLSLERLNLMGGNAETFLATRGTTTLAEMATFIYALLGACAKDLGHTEPINLPDAPDGSEHKYVGLRPDPNPDMLGALQGEQGGVLEYLGFLRDLGIQYEPARQDIYRYISEVTVALDRFDILLYQMEASIPAAQRETVVLADCFRDMREAAKVWMGSSCNIDALLAFRRAGEKFMQHSMIQRHHFSPSFLGRTESDPLKAFKCGLQELRDYSKKRQQIKTEGTWTSVFFSDQMKVSLPIIAEIAFFECLEMYSVLPLFVHIGFTFPLMINFIHGVYLASYLWEMPWEASNEYIEASRDLWSRIPLLVSASAVGGALAGLGLGLLTVGAEVSLMVSTFLAISLISSTLALLLPVALVLIGRGVAEGVNKVGKVLLGSDEEKQTESAELSPG